MTVRLHHETHGDPAAPPIVLLGSLGSNAHMWDPQISALSSRAHVIAVDHRGHGGSPAPAGPYTVSDLGGDMLATLDTLGLDEVHVVGLSLGGAVGQWLAAHHPLRVRALTLLCTSARFTPAQPWLDRAATVRGGGIATVANSVVERWFTPELAQRDSQLVAHHVDMVRGTNDEGYAACCEALARWDGRADLSRIVAPTLVIAAEQDGATPVPELRAIADGIAGAELHILSPGAHLASVEQAGAVTQLIERHIAAVGSVEMSRRVLRDVGSTVRRSVLGAPHVERTTAGSTPFTEPFQDFITRTAWGDIWARDGLDHTTRRLLTMAILTAVGNEHELDMHIRAALRAGTAPELLMEVFLHTAVYAGVPNSNRAFALGKEALADLASETRGASERDG
ncbi:3-oxoadipate enol-lactonase [Rhodococcus rhodnii]|uniref:3-oxoadipate enol-lactone n=2 Tax=Rhodococcus rhodnii TaxID=38312 RepID=R7WNR2_9NOCA|nr:3-oxoadipate enol-lactonase [Rhodococcus rhodnii]EOM76943.1 3-oxoadipate enol-lactone [Rhodococcus rhodnii LMG 5362]TXG89828.1 3-oxoadipate enol-lactonase [Rhodococcus rhodnii]